MPLTQRFHELIDQLNLPEAAWHLSRTNTGTEIHATQEEINAGRELILELINNQGNHVTQILAQINSELEKIDPLTVLIERKPQGAPFDGEIARRISLERRKKQAELILNGGFTVIQGGDLDEGGKGPQNLALTIDVAKLPKAA